MFFGNSKTKINERWNVDNFVIGSGNKSRRNPNGESKDEYELNNTIKKIDQAYSSGKSELESILREIKNKRKEIRARFKALENDPENEASFHKMDMDLLLSQVKISETKVKFSADKFKQIRDEKKLNIDKTPKGPDTQVLVNQQNNPLSNIAPVSTTPIIRVNSVDPSAIINTQSRYDVPAESQIEYTEKNIPIPSTSGAGGGSVAHTSINSEPAVPVSKSWDGEVIRTVDDLTDARQRKVMERLNGEESAFANMKSVQGIDYSRSINAMVNKTKDLTKTMYINKNNGTYYVRTYENVDGNIVPNETELFDSILHIGVPEFNSKNRTVKTQYEDESIPYVLLEDSDDMPKFYRDSWRDPSLRRFILTDEILDVL